MDTWQTKAHGGCRKFLLLFGRIGPLALRPCAVLRAWDFLPHSINILQIPWWYGDMDWYGMSCARPCALLRGPAFLMPLYHALKILISPEDVIERTGFFINPHMPSLLVSFMPQHACWTPDFKWSCTSAIRAERRFKSKAQFLFFINISITRPSPPIIPRASKAQLLQW